MLNTLSRNGIAIGIGIEFGSRRRFCVGRTNAGTCVNYLTADLLTPAFQATDPRRSLAAIEVIEN